MNIRTALDRIVTLQLALTITAPITASIKAAHKYPPNRGIALPDTPCWMNSWTLDRVEREYRTRHAFYEVSAQLFVLDTDLNRAADIATAFHVAFMDALDTSASINDDAAIARWDHGGSGRASDPTLSLLDWAGKSYIGLSEFLRLELLDTVTFT